MYNMCDVTIFQLGIFSSMQEWQIWNESRSAHLNLVVFIRACLILKQQRRLRVWCQMTGGIWFLLPRF